MIFAIHQLNEQKITSEVLRFGTRAGTCFSRIRWMAADLRGIHPLDTAVAVYNMT